MRLNFFVHLGFQTIYCFFLFFLSVVSRLIGAIKSGIKNKTSLSHHYEKAWKFLKIFLEHRPAMLQFFATKFNGSDDTNEFQPHLFYRKILGNSNSDSFWSAWKMTAEGMRDGLLWFENGSNQLFDYSDTVILENSNHYFLTSLCPSL